tara:strand:+ start:1151 stop:1675 length:525 start_codon:yes stop_codon:yes gene_type:complete
MKLPIILSALLLSASPAVAQAPGRELPEEYKSDNWVVVSEHQNPVQKKQYEMALIDKSSFKNTSGSRWDFDIAFLQWDTYANPNQYAFTWTTIASGHWVDCNKGMYVVEGNTPGSETYREYYYSRSGAWLEKSEFESGPYQFQDDGWNEKSRLSDNRWTRTFNLICGANFKTRQ